MVYCKILIFMIKLTRENEAITSFQHFKIWGFILTMRNVNWEMGGESKPVDGGFILTMRNVNVEKVQGVNRKVKVLY